MHMLALLPVQKHLAWRSWAVFFSVTMLRKSSAKQEKSNMFSFWHILFSLCVSALGRLRTAEGVTSWLYTSGLLIHLFFFSMAVPSRLTTEVQPSLPTQPLATSTRFAIEKLRNHFCSTGALNTSHSCSVLWSFWQPITLEMFWFFLIQWCFIHSDVLLYLTSRQRAAITNHQSFWGHESCIQHHSLVST